MSFGNSNIDLNTTLACVDSRTGSKTLYLPSTTTIYGKYIVVKDIGGSASSNTITLNTVGGEVFENNRTFLHISTNFGFTSLVANNGKWTSLTTPYENLGDRYLISTLNITNAGFGVSSLSSIVAYGLSTVALQPAPGVSSLSSIVGYGLVNVAAGTGVSSLSSIVGYGLSTVALQPAPGVSSLSSIVAYGLSTVALQPAPGVSSLSSIVAYGLSTVARQPAPGVSSLSSIVAYGLSTVARQPAPGVSSLSSIVAYGLSTVAAGSINPGVSSLSSIVGYGLSSLGGQTAPGISSLSSIVSYGLSSFIIPLSTFSTAISTRFTTSSLEANVISSSYGLFSTLSTGNILVGYVTSPLQVDVGVATVDIIASNITVNYGFVTENLGIGKEAPYWYTLDVSGVSRLPIISSVTVTANSFIGDGSGVTNVQNAGVSSLSSIISYGLSTITRQPTPGVSSLSSIVAYGLSTVAAGSINPGVSSLSSIVAYGLSTVAAGSINPGVSSLSSIVAYGLSTVAAGSINPGVSSLSSIVAYGLSTVAAGSINPGVSSLSSIVAYGLSSLGGQTAPGISSLSSIVSYGLSSFIIPLSTFSTAISTRFTTSSLGANVISSTYGLFSTLSTENIIARSGEISNNLSVGSNLLVLGSIGINCNTPSYSLDIDGTAHITGDILAVGTTTLSNLQYTSNYIQRVVFTSDNTNSNIGIYFYNESNQTITPTGNTSHINDVFYNGSLWVAVVAAYGVIQTSVDGSNWSNVTITEDDFTGYYVTYANNLWVVTGGPPAFSTAGPKLFTSLDGNVWTPNTNYYGNRHNKAIYNSIDGYWLIPTKTHYGQFTLIYTTDPSGDNLIRLNPFDIECRAVCWNGSNLWVAVGKTEYNNANQNIQYSYDGSNWTSANNLTDGGNQFFVSEINSIFGGCGVAYGSNGVWLAVGDTAQGDIYNTIYSSTDGINFSGINSNYKGLYDVKYLGGSSWLATYNTLSSSSTSNGLIISSDNGSNWSNISLADQPQLINLYNEIQVTILPYSNILALDVYGNTNLHGDLTVSGIVSMSNITAYNITTTDLVATNQITTSNIITNLLTFIDQTYGSNQFLNVASNLLYFNNTIIAGSRYFKPQFITFP